MSNPTAEKEVVPTRLIAPYTSIKLMPSGNHVQIIQHSEHRIELDRDAVALLLQWLDRAGFGEIETWPGIPE